MKRKGLTLIELVISIAILGLISVTILNIFNSGLMNIIRAGDITELTSNAISDVDKKILTSVVGEDNVSENEIDISLPGLSYSIPIRIKGKLITHETIDLKGNSVSIKTFVPY